MDHDAHPAGTSPGDRASLLGERFADRLAEAWQEPVKVVSASRLTGGASRETWSMTVQRDTGEQRVIARIEAGTEGTLGLETDAVAAAAAVGVPVPEIYASGQDAEIGGSFLLVEHVDGETIPRKLLRDEEYAAARAGMARTLGEVLARIHTAQIDRPERLTVVTDPVGDLVEHYGGGVPPAPGLALGIRRLREQRPEPGPTTFVHGDFRLGNLLIAPTGLAAVLDWELVHVGDPVEDLGWLCAKVWRFGSPHAAGGMGSRAELLDGYASVAGWRPSEEQVAWWELLATVKWGLMCQRMAAAHVAGEKLSVERAAIGRRTCEQEFDVLLLLGHDAPHTAPELPGGPDTPDLYGWPTAAQLADGVAHYLTTGPQPLGGALGFEARVAANVVAMMRREALLGETARRAHARRLADLGVTGERELSLAIEHGTLDDRWPDVVGTVRASVRDRVAVSNPGHLSRPA